MVRFLATVNRRSYVNRADNLKLRLVTKGLEHHKTPLAKTSLMLIDSWNRIEDTFGQIPRSKSTPAEGLWDIVAEILLSLKTHDPEVLYGKVCEQLDLNVGDLPELLSEVKGRRWDLETEEDRRLFMSCVTSEMDLIIKILLRIEVKLSENPKFRLDL